MCRVESEGGQMAIVSRRLRLLVCAVGFFVALPLLTVMPDLLDRRSGCDRLTDWVGRHRSDLPVTLSGLSAYPESYRLRVFAALPAARKTALMVEHVASFDSNARGLTVEQRRFLREYLIPKIRAGAMYDESLSQERRETYVREIEQRIASALPNDIAYRVFYTLGEPRVTPNTFEAFRIALAQSIRAYVTVE